MSTSSPRSGSAAPDEAPASIPQTTPIGVGYGHPEYHFVQSIMEMQKSLGEINASITDLRKSVDGTKAKVDDLVAWKNKILGGVIAVGALVSVLAFVIGKFSDYVTIKTPSQPPSVMQTPQGSQKGK